MRSPWGYGSYKEFLSFHYLSVSDAEAHPLIINHQYTNKSLKYNVQLGIPVL